MRLEDYWGVGPKTAALLTEELGAETAARAIESADSRTLVEAGLSRGRATRILRRANGGEGMDVLATEDARSVYKDLVSLAESYAVTDHAADRVRVLTPLLDPVAVEDRLDSVMAAVESWRALDDETRTDVLDAFERYDEAGGTDRAAVDAALVLRETGVHEGVFAPLADCDPDALADAADALRFLDGDRVTGIDEKPEGPVDTNRINAGVYGFSPAVFDAIRETHAPGELAITATLNDMAATRGVTAVSYDGRWLDVSNLWDVLTVNAALIDERAGARDDTRSPTDRDEPVSIAGDVALAGNVRIGPNVTVGGATAVGSNATIAANAVVENAVVFPDAVIGPGAVVRDAVVASNARIGPNATVAGGPATIVVGDAVHRDVALGGVVGDNTTVGAGATVTDGAIVGDGVHADAGVVIDGRVEPGAGVRRG